jgi:hypothetical protein
MKLGDLIKQLQEQEKIYGSEIEVLVSNEQDDYPIFEIIQGTYTNHSTDEQATGLFLV